ncbi:hypothetical protein WJX72_011712 [[Myrmecia] bisecta]|uniref:Dienelactone hydrolase domain-containing protein n=1 Tax=[Myrmecia] bisecta TaxID=41462 RepID=A0AAW1PI67_9CHLO
MADHRQCCDKGYDWAGTPVGTVRKLGGLDTYISQPAKQTDKAILVIGDVWGWELKNARLTADKYAAAGFLAVVPDLLRGKPYAPPSEFGKFDMDSFGPWVAQHPAPRVNKDIDQVLAGLTNEYGIKTVSAIGFCWGGQFAAHLAAQEKINAAVIPHGSFITDELVESIKKPVLFLCPEKDFVMSAEQRGKIKQILAKKSFDHDVVTYEDMEHGFSLRGNDKDEKVAKAAADAFDRGLKFFKTHMRAKKKQVPAVGLLVWAATAALVVTRIVQERRK